MMFYEQTLLSSMKIGGDDYSDKDKYEEVVVDIDESDDERDEKKEIQSQDQEEYSKGKTQNEIETGIERHHEEVV